MTCRKTAWADEATALHKAERVARLNGHGMRAYHCDRCGSWHLTSDGDKVLPWRRIDHGEFRARFGDSEFVVWQISGDRWMATCPNGLRVGSFSGLGEARQWCDATSFLPEDRWQRAASRV